MIQNVKINKSRGQLLIMYHFRKKQNCGATLIAATKNMLLMDALIPVMCETFGTIITSFTIKSLSLFVLIINFY